jgi:protein phosphatase methylesterase 1
MGAAVAVEVMAQKLVKVPVIGTCVVDVVEGTAMESLGMMNSILSSRPKQFKNVQDAVNWAMRTNQIRNKESASISIPSQLIQKEDKYVWRTDLTQSKPFWEGWFSGLSQKFLSIRGAKLLILAGTDRLDKPLMIGQMQGILKLM